MEPQRLDNSDYHSAALFVFRRSETSTTICYQLSGILHKERYISWLNSLFCIFTGLISLNHNMNLRILSILLLFPLTHLALSQTLPGLNNTDQMGRKQGPWTKRYPNESIMYEGVFKDDHPVGEFRRYYEDNTQKSLLVFSPDGKKADATNYHPNGNIASKGTYINQKKEGIWNFFSESQQYYRLSEENYSGNLRNGITQKFYRDSTTAEKITYLNDVKHGEWLQYHPNGVLSLRSAYNNGKINGKFEVWYENGKIQFSGQYLNDVRDGLWLIYNPDGTIKYRLEYAGGITNDRQIDIDMSDYLDSLEKNKGLIADPEQTGTVW